MQAVNSKIGTAERRDQGDRGELALWGERERTLPTPTPQFLSETGRRPQRWRCINVKRRRMSKSESSKLASIFSGRPELDYLPRVGIRLKRLYPCSELIYAVLRMTKKQKKLSQATEANGEIKSMLQVSRFSAKSHRWLRTEIYLPPCPHGQKYNR